MSLKPNLIILVPLFDDSGPMKGAAALANGLADEFAVTLVALKGVRNQNGLLPAIRILSLESEKKIQDKLRALEHLIETPPAPIACISFCFSADLANWFLRKRVRVISSVRGNLMRNYYHSYGPLGYLLAAFHYLFLRSFSKVVVISATMGKQLEKWRLPLEVIENFIDEPRLEPHRISSGRDIPSTIRFLFVGGLNIRKQPGLLLESFHELKRNGHEFSLSIAGDGPLRGLLEGKIEDLGLDDEVELLGHVSDPYGLYQNHDFLVLPSRSEGISRSVLEGLFFGMPCVLRRIDGNEELTGKIKNCFLFSCNQDLTPTLKQVFAQWVPNRERSVLIPPDFRFENGIRKFKSLLANGIQP